MTEDQQMAFAIQMSLGSQQGVNDYVYMYSFCIYCTCTYIHTYVYVRASVCGYAVLSWWCIVCRYPKV